MVLKIGDCNKIKNLRERLECLKKKYSDLTDLLELERIDYGAEEVNTNFAAIEDERNIIAQLIAKTESKMKELDKANKATSLKEFKDTIQPGNRVILKNLEKELAVKLADDYLDSEEAVVSINSPIGKAILGRRVGDKVKISSPRGVIDYNILAIM